MLVCLATIPGVSMLQPKKPSNVRFAANESARCPRCFAKMTLARVTPGSPGFEIRSLECPECEHAIARRVAVDPELRPENRHGVGKSPWSA
jgi:hypothetical protein